MELKDIIAIRGKGDLYKIIAKTPQGIVVESINEKKTKFKVQPDLHVLMLSDITIFSNDNSELYLQDLFLNIYEKDGLEISVNPKDAPNTLRDYFKKVAPNHDEERVYNSDMKKMVKWFLIIKEWYPDVFENLKKEKEKEKKAVEDEKKKTSKKEVASKDKSSVDKEEKPKKKKETPKKKEETVKKKQEKTKKDSDK